MDNKINTREKIILAASKLFQSKGYNATGMNEILKVSGAPKGSLYYHFPNGKEELALEAIKLASENIQRSIRKTLGKFSDPIEGIQVHFRNLAEFITKEKGVVDLSISLLALETYSSSEILREACKSAFESLRNIYVHELIKIGFDEKKAYELSFVIQSMVEGAVTISLTRKDGTALLAVANQIGIILNTKS